MIARESTIYFEGTSIQSKLGPNWSFQIGGFQAPNRWRLDSLCAQTFSLSGDELASTCPRRFPSGSPCVFACRGNKPANSPKGQPPDADGHSSVTDLANSLTGDMVMVRPPISPHIQPAVTYADES